jgi:hypothetical protein
MPDQHSSFPAMPPAAARPSGVQVQSLHQTRVQGINQVYTGQETRGGRQMPFNFRHGAHPQAVVTVHPPHGGGSHSFPLGHGVR